MYTRQRGCLSLISLWLAILAAGWAAPARAQGTEMERLQQCDRDLCAILSAPSRGSGPLQCDLSKTWYKEQIDKIMRPKGLGWVFGDADCKLKLDIERSRLARAMTHNSYTLRVPEQAASCEVEYRGSRYPVTVTLAPEIRFARGRATAVSLGVRGIKANPIVKALLWSATKLQSSMGLYQDDIVRGVNRYIGRECRVKSGRRQARLEDIGGR
jgi:hypothetical protein